MVTYKLKIKTIDGETIKDKVTVEGNIPDAYMNDPVAWFLDCHCNSNSITLSDGFVMKDKIIKAKITVKNIAYKVRWYKG